jgi:hypothetical protein
MRPRRGVARDKSAINRACGARSLRICNLHHK